MDLKKEKNKKLIRVLVFNIFVIMLFLICAFFIAKTKNSSAATSNVQQVRSVNVKNTNKFLYPVIDTCSTMNQGITKTQLDATMSRLKNMGFNKVYIILMPDDYPSLTMTSIKPLSASLGGSYSKNEISIQSLGNNPNKVFLEYAHKYGLEAIAIYKPYEGGGGSTIPSSSVPQFSNYVENRVSENTVGGKRLYFERFVSQNLDLRVKRIENQQEKANSKLAINKIEMNFYKHSESNATADITSGLNLNTLNDTNNKADKPTLWISEDNGEYYVYDNFTYAYSFHDGYEIRDVNNFPTGQTKKVLKLTINIQGLNKKYRYVAVTFNSDSTLQKNQNPTYTGNVTYPHSMIKIYNNTTEIPSTISFEVRVPINKSNYVPGADKKPVNSMGIKGFDQISCDSNGRVESISTVYKNSGSGNGSEEFYKYGFEFHNSIFNVSGNLTKKTDEKVPGGSYSGAINSGVYAIAAGKEEYCGGMLCEGYPKVRNHWLSEVREALELGYDGIDIRTAAHSSYLIDFAYYGFNQPIIDVYKNRYGSYPTTVNETVAKRIMEIRGEFFLQFLTDAADLTHRYGAKFVTHIIASQYDNLFDANFKFTRYGHNDIATNPNPKIIINNYEKLIDISDEITIKDYYTDNYSEAEQEKQELIVNYAKSKNKKILIHGYINQPGNSVYNMDRPTFFRNLATSEVDGALLYEVTHKENVLTDFQEIVNTYGQSGYEEVPIVLVTSVGLNKTSMNIQKGRTEQLTATINPRRATNKAVTWTSSNEEVATVDNTGKVTAVGKGSATITVKTKDAAKIATCKVTVIEPIKVDIPVISVELNKTSISIQKGKIEQLTATVKPNDASNQGVTWTSSNEEVATVDNTGKVTAIGKGSTTITVETINEGKIAICKVKVTENPSKINEPIKTIDQKKSIHPFIICSVLVFAGFLIFVFKNIKNRGV